MAFVQDNYQISNFLAKGEISFEVTTSGGSLVFGGIATFGIC